jgi:type IV secretion system T-DNA border endonuclease VirD1
MTVSSSPTDPAELRAGKSTNASPNKRRVLVASAERYRNVCIRLREAEYDQFVRDVEALGLTSSMALRIAARRIAGFIEVDSDLRLELEATLSAVGTTSQVLRDLHGAVTAGGIITMEQLDDQRTYFGEAFARLDGMLRSILNVSQRRADGRTLLKDAAQ